MEGSDISFPDLDFIESPRGEKLAYRRRAGASPTLLFLPGYASDMEGAKALAIDQFASRRGLGLVRFDYSGTGSSGGHFEDGTLDLWLDEALAVVDQVTEGPIILIGSSMGGWLAVHAALRRPGRVNALVGIAAAPDFTNWGFTDDEKAQIERNGHLGHAEPVSDGPQLITRDFWLSGEALRLLDGPVDLDCPVRLVHGEKDEDVPVEIAARLMRQLRSGDVQLTILKGGGHRLSEPLEIEAILRTIEALVEPSP